MAETELAIIGGGASAVLLLAALARDPAAAGMRVDLYEREGARAGRGIAYSTQQNVHLLNVRAANMSALESEKDDFAAWAGERGFKPQDFVPRKLYGAYLSEKLEHAQKILNINIIEADVGAIRKVSKEEFEITYGKRKRSYAVVVQATGNARPLKPKAEGEIAWYFEDPWKTDFPALGNMRHIALIGSGLTATDMVLALYAQNFQGKISIISRHALLPATHAAPSTWPSFLVPEDYARTPYALLRRIHAEVAKAEEQNIPWQAVMDSLRPHTNPLWEAMGKKTRERFMKRLLTLWNVHRHRMAPQIAQAMDVLIKAGRVEMVKASVESVAAGPVVRTSIGTIEADAVINCLGYRYQEEGRKYEPTEKIGPARFGEQFETTAIPEVRAQAAEIAARILKHY